MTFLPPTPAYPWNLTASADARARMPAGADQAAVPPPAPAQERRDCAGGQVPGRQEAAGAAGGRAVQEQVVLTVALYCVDVVWCRNR